MALGMSPAVPARPAQYSLQAQVMYMHTTEIEMHRPRYIFSMPPHRISRRSRFQATMIKTLLI